MSKAWTDLIERIPSHWQTILSDAIHAPSFQALAQFLDAEWRKFVIYPPKDQIFRALQLTSPESIRVVIVGQDPYHGPGQAHGLAFSVPSETSKPPSLVNIEKELRSDLGMTSQLSGDLSSWAEQGVLLLNTVLTVRANAPLSHRKHGWEEFTDSVIDAVNAVAKSSVFLLWGNSAQSKSKRIDQSRHHILSAAHPSPLSARRGFFGSQPFSQANAWLQTRGREPIDWLAIRSGKETRASKVSAR